MSANLLVLLPPSETKRDGGSSRFIGPLGWPELDPIRRQTCEDLVRLSEGDAERAAKALKISPKLAERELARNRELLGGPSLLPALDRYTGVLFDALDAASLSPEARAWAESHVAIHSALFGLVRGGDGIPAYRLSHDSAIGSPTLKQRWREPIAHVLAEHSGPILDLRSKGYVELGPVAPSPERFWVEVAERDAQGRFRSLNHFNKREKGRLVRLLADLSSKSTTELLFPAMMTALSQHYDVSEREQGGIRIIPREPAHHAHEE